MENNNKNIKEQQIQSIEHISKHEIIITDKKSKKGTKVLLIILGILILIGILNWNELSKYNYNNRKYYYIIIAEKLNFVQKKSEDSKGKITFTIIRELHFGTGVEINLNDSAVHQDDKTYYRCTCYSLENSADKYFKEKENYLEATTFDELESSYRSVYLKTFPIKEAQQLPVSIKRAIVEYFFSIQDYDDNENFCFTQDVNRIKKSIFGGNFGQQCVFKTDFLTLNQCENK